MSAARSITAFSAACFCRTQVLPPSLASVGRLFVPPDVLLHQADLRGRHVELRAPVELQLQVLFDLAVLVQQLQAAVAGDAVATWTTRSPSRSSRKLSIALPSRRARRAAAGRRGGTARRC